MVTHFLKDGHQPWLTNIFRMGTNHPPSKGVVEHHPQDGHPPAVKLSTTIPGILITFPRTVKSPTISRMVNQTWSLTLAQIFVLFCYCKARAMSRLFSQDLNLACQSWSCLREEIDIINTKCGKRLQCSIACISISIFNNLYIIV